MGKETALRKGTPTPPDPGARPAPELRCTAMTLGYAAAPIFSDLSLSIPPDGFTVIIGPNGSGKSTLLRALARMLRPAHGTVILDGTDIRSMPTKAVARRLGLLPQSPSAPPMITVWDLVLRGRFPHQGIMGGTSRADREAVAAALDEVGLADLAHRPVDELSGGQRQRAWIAMLLAQQTPIILLDEPTTYLDIAHQLGVLDLCSRLHDSGRTMVAVLHDLNLAARYATHVIVVADGRIASSGPPEEVITKPMLQEVFGLQAAVTPDPWNGRPLVIPRDSRSYVPVAAAATRITTTDV